VTLWQSCAGEQGFVGSALSRTSDHRYAGCCAATRAARGSRGGEGWSGMCGRVELSIWPHAPSLHECMSGEAQWRNQNDRRTTGPTDQQISSFSTSTAIHHQLPCIICRCGRGSRCLAGGTGGRWAAVAGNGVARRGGVHSAIDRVCVHSGYRRETRRRRRNGKAAGRT
jgi:hypothetical protein